MSEPDRRRRMISLRLSQVEYDVLKKQHLTYGARNASDLARLALQRMVSGPPASIACVDEMSAAVTELRGRVNALESRISDLELLASPARDSMVSAR